MDYMSKLTESYWMRVFYKYLFVIFGFTFGLYAFYISFTGETTLFNMMAMMAGFMLAFTAADRNVYYDRLGNLFHALGDLDSGIEINRFDYTEYEVVMGNRVGRSERDENKESREDTTDQKRLDEVEN